MNVIIVEDEAVARQNLKTILRQVAPDANVLATMESVTDTVMWLKSNPAPDLIFMDIHLSDGDSFLIFSAVDVRSPIIFTTAYDSYALRAFKVNAIDYLLKPLHPKDVEQAVAKWRNTQGASPTLPKYESLVASDETPHTQAKRNILVFYKDRIIPLSTEQIAYFRTQNDRVELTTMDGRTYPHDKSLASIAEMLASTQFFRANRQYIVSRNFISEIIVHDSYRLLLVTQQDTPEPIFVSKDRVSVFKTWLQEG